jgi:hypothetical protein
MCICEGEFDGVGTYVHLPTIPYYIVYSYPIGFNQFAKPLGISVQAQQTGFDFRQTVSDFGVHPKVLRFNFCQTVSQIGAER